MSINEQMHVRPVRDEDADKLFALIGRCFAEYDDVVVEPKGLDADLQSYATYLEKTGGEGYVIDQGDAIVALVSGMPIDEKRYQLKRIYMDQVLRGTGMAPKLLRLVEARACAIGAQSLELWSDTRFVRAHRFYEREGFVQQKKSRTLSDSSNTTEYQFVKILL